MSKNFKKIPRRRWVQLFCGFVSWIPFMTFLSCVCMCMYMLSHVPLFAALWTVACQPTLPVEFFQARTLELGAISYSRGSSLLRGGSRISFVSCIGRRILYH